MSHKLYGNLKTINGIENVVCGFAICEDKNPDPNLYTELEGVEPVPEPKLYVGRQWDAGTNTFSEEYYLPVYKTDIQTDIPPAKEKVKSWTEAYDMAVELGSSAEVVADLLAKKDEAVTELQALLIKWQEAE